MKSIGRCLDTSIAALALLGLLLHSSIATSSTVIVIGREPGLAVNATIGVIVFDPSKTLLRGVSNGTLVLEVNCTESYRAVIRARILYVYAPEQFLERLVSWMKENYEDRGVPSWVNETLIPPGREVKWLRLRSFYDYLWSLVQDYWGSTGVLVSDTVAIIGDVDSVSRQYYEPPANGAEEGIAGVKGWAGNRPLTFYDLTVVPAPWPLPSIPFYGEGRHVDSGDEPPLWMLGDPGEYVQELVEDHLRYHYTGYCVEKPWYATSIAVHVVVVDYGNRSVVEEVLGELNASLVEAFLSATDPFTVFNVSVEVVNATPVLRSIVEDAVEEDGWLVLSFNSVRKAVSMDAKTRFSHLVDCRDVEWGGCGYAFYILATPRRSFMRFDGTLFNFTGFSAGYYGATSYPGYGYRVERGGLARVIAHEVGHYLGLGHPFQDVKGTRWLMDMIESVMSYYDPGVSFYRYGDVFYYDALKTGLIHLPVLLEKSGRGAPREAYALLREGRVVEAVFLLAREARSKVLGESSGAAGTVTVTATRTVTATATVTVTVTETVVSTTTLTRSTYNSTYTSTYTSTVPGNCSASLVNRSRSVYSGYALNECCAVLVVVVAVAALVLFWERIRGRRV